MSHPAFTLIERRRVPEINGEVFRYRHNATGADVVSVVCPDDNKCFGISFKTPPSDSTGVAHILEHSVLCGSRKFPLKEPFKELLKGSLQTFLNAMTYPDKTVYPVASRNLKDFYNLVDVYLDAVFFPCLGEHAFQQEGWHYELKDHAEPLAIQGVVYNEMKGNYSSPEGMACELAQRMLFPDTTYGHDSGGDPAHIPDLTYADFIGFHRRFYNPANTQAFFWGDDDPDKRLQILDDYFSAVPANPEPVEIPLQSRFDQPRSVEHNYMPNAEEGEAGCYVIAGWGLDENTDVFRNLSLGLLANLLIGTPASPLRKTLIESNLGEDITGPGFENHTRQMFLATGLKGVSPENVEKVVALIHDTLAAVVERGFEPDLIEAALNQLEFNLRENNTGTFPRGLAAFLRISAVWNHGGDPLETIGFEKWLSRLQQRLRDEPRYFENLIRANLMENPHRALLVMKPDPGHGAVEAGREQQRLAAADRELGESGRSKVLTDSTLLLARQREADPAEALSSIPMLTIGDLEARAPLVEKQEEEIGGVTVIFHPQPTSGIVYLDLALSLLEVEESDMVLLPLFARALTELGTRRRDYAALTNLISRKTGGVDASLFTVHHMKTKDLIGRLMLRSKVVLPRLGDLLDILTEILTELRTDVPDRFLQMLGEEISDAEEGVVPSGHSLVRSRLAAHFSLSEDCSERMGGVDYLHALGELESAVEDSFEGVRNSLENIASRVVHRQGLVVNVTGEPSAFSAVREGLRSFFQRLPATPSAQADPWIKRVRQFPEGLSIPAKVQYIGQALSLYDTGYRYHASAMVAARWLRNGWLWDRVRVQGGAYGCLCGFDFRTGALAFCSYRDPQTVRTLEAYAGTPDFLRAATHAADELTRNVIGASGDLNPCLLPDAKGYGSFVRHLTGMDDEFRQRNWDEVRGTRPEHILAFADAIEAALPKALVSALGPEDRLRELEIRTKPLRMISVF